MGRIEDRNGEVAALDDAGYHGRCGEVLGLDDTRGL